MPRYGLIRLWPGLFGILVVAGCDGAPSGETSSQEATVAGSVSVKGQRMNSGEVLFTPVGPRPNGAVRSIKVKPDGSYEIKTLVGTNQVRISGPVVKKDPLLGYATKTVDVLPTGTVAHLDFP